MKEIRYQLEVEGVKAFLAPLTFPVAEAALGSVFCAEPKYISAGEIILNSLWVKGSAKLKDEKGDYFIEACMQAYATIDSIEYTFENNIVSIPYTSKDKQGKTFTKIYKCEIKEKINRDTMEKCLSLLRPNGGNPRPLSAGLLILEQNWVNGDEEIKTNDELKIAACTACYYLVNMKTASLKKL